MVLQGFTMEKVTKNVWQQCKLLTRTSEIKDFFSTENVRYGKDLERARKGVFGKDVDASDHLEITDGLVGGRAAKTLMVGRGHEWETVVSGLVK